MKYLIILIISLLGTAHAGNCDFADDRAADGSRCGKRSADSRF
jgi:hypothetical protein